jgi:hypothetical protein
LKLDTSQVLDLGGGYGLLCRLLRDKGINAFTSDPYCENIFAKNFTAGESHRARVVTAFEVMEHIPNPKEYLRSAISAHGAEVIIFSTLTFDGEVPPMDWWYYAFETGQHISLYSDETLTVLAAELGMHRHSLDPGFHILTLKPLSAVRKFLMGGPFNLIRYVTYIIHRLQSRGRSLIQSDYEAAKKSLISAAISFDQA